MNITIRRATAEDSDRLLELLRQIANLHHKHRPDLFKADGTKYSREQLEKIYADENRPIFVAVADSSVVGYCFCQITRYKNSTVSHDCTELYLDDLCVDENIRRQGIGQMLFEEAKNFAEQIGASRLILNVWEFNEAAIKFYENCGTTPIVRRMEMIL